MKEILKDNLKEKHNKINLITEVSDTSENSVNKTDNSSDLSLRSTSRSYKFAGELSPPDNWWTWTINSDEDRIEIDSDLYDWVYNDVDLTLYDPSLNFIDDDTIDGNGLYVLAYTNGVSG
ncbi:hypothetical protein [Methanosarcina siciliae]|uniref:hypothetical protein n=1 Tax=Methanosarcina siciliae TaxID=38027 RepID=UPI00064E765A|nr:hypothetical protein [Methanosarcina siciliae]